MYGRCHDGLPHACDAFHSSCPRNVVSWNAIISAHIGHGQSVEALQLFEQMKQEAEIGNAITFAVILQVCANQSALREGTRIHACISVGGDDSIDVIVNTALINLYGKCDRVKIAEEIFRAMSEHNEVSCNSMIAAYARYGGGRNAIVFFLQMLRESLMPTDVTFINIFSGFLSQEEDVWRGKQLHACINKSLLFDSNVGLGNALIGMYRRCGNSVDAHRAFNMMPVKDFVSWNALIASYSEQNKADEVFQLFADMLLQGFLPNKTTFSSVISTCASVIDLQKGMRMHTVVILRGLQLDLLVCNALITMYGKCGDLPKATEVFNRTHGENTVSWNAILDAYAQHGEASQVLRLYEKMQSDHVLPDLITFTSILTVCSRFGLVDEACSFLMSMDQDYGLIPTCDHFNCVVDLLGRLGKLEEAETILSSMPVSYTAVSTRALLSACRYQSDIERAKRMAKDVFVLDSENTGPYTMLRDLYKAAG